MSSPDQRNLKFEALLRPIAPDLYRTAYRLSGNRSDAEDLVQELFVRLFLRFEQWCELPDPRPWILRVLRNLHVDLYRKRARTHGVNPASLHPDPDHLDTLSADTRAPASGAGQLQLQHRIRAALDTLEAEQRALVVLHLIEGHTLESLCPVFDAPLGTLKSRLHRCKEKLREQLPMEPFPENRRLSR